MAEQARLSISPPAPAPAGECHAMTLAAVGQALDKLRFGQVLLTVHEGKVVQFEVTEKQRFA
ncbi:MAG TPA: YezD family protein [Novosphingobium sp.]|jgi:hypothetical protein|nr:YezD family protein [Novosphingobium sp.]HOA48148.1 YezD family protein [Novosphingobium sp.]HPB22242.1 YezD family protein [Novosphingobium sp.]HPZ45508.1 YezD family protein [Novosphingobium sp.]HQD98533.1 YezD family protein [Novosphingobium sp.]